MNVGPATHMDSGAFGPSQVGLVVPSLQGG